MAAAETEVTSGRAVGRFDAGTEEFSRLVNLSDAVFAIAMTLLVLGLETPDVQAGDLAGALLEEFPQLIAFVLAFGLTANLWWQHHKLFSRLRFIDVPMVALALAFLGAVALVPFPTSLVGAMPTARAAVVPFVGVFLLISLLSTALVWRCGTTGAWCAPPPPRAARWVRAGWLVNVVVIASAGGVALVWPVGGLIVLALGTTAAEMAMRAVGPPGYREWS
jgi:uncharacterized membrane protein